MADAPDLSIVIVSYRTRELLDRCLASIFGARSNLSIQVIVADNDSRDGTAEMVREKFPEVLLFDNKKNLGYSAANNQGILAARGRNILLLNPDTETNPAALEAMSGFLDRHPRVGAAGCSLLNTDGSPQTSHFSIPMPLMSRFEGTRFHSGLARTLLRLPDIGPAIDEPGARRVDIVKGACLMLSKKALDDVGLLDEDSFLYADDIDWCMRARKRGWDAYLLENHTIVHHGYASTDQETYLTVVSSRRSALLLYRKHYPRIAAAFWELFIRLEIIYKYRLNASRARRPGADEKTKEKFRAYKTLMDEIVPRGKT
jgi:GT2 family glycosyltransferase